jgi:hypothetical protein
MTMHEDPGFSLLGDPGGRLVPSASVRGAAGVIADGTEPLHAPEPAPE